ncbi:hypothetical protein AQSSE17_02420 [Streptococcus equi subsp. equi]|nr:hypothetical protein AQSSE01_15320 [Streptococcus equi subsp. equi]GMX71097.1 hypothetical protein AQSSE11_15820 [Streptococcus equi subsp. equi]GMX72760.1 hypothetical protein AQSSE02_16720 [Streptococcus equi subsp. equi]GMX73861.1 hypothetical protein AQSSE12_10440 [Streptococcus equi subsp. equi]GMX76068.1 hypothetical protein AQSSE13_01010 [Streptococcus equi subsp. equi]
MSAAFKESMFHEMSFIFLRFLNDNLNLYCNKKIRPRRLWKLGSVIGMRTGNV